MQRTVAELQQRLAEVEEAHALKASRSEELKLVSPKFKCFLAVLILFIYAQIGIEYCCVLYKLLKIHQVDWTELNPL